MTDFLLHYHSYFAVILFAVGFLMLLLCRNMIKKIVGMNIMDTATYLFLAVQGYIHNGVEPIINQAGDAIYVNPVPTGLVLTGIVVSVSVTAFALALTQRLYKKYGTVNIDELTYIVRNEKKGENA